MLTTHKPGDEKHGRETWAWSNGKMSSGLTMVSLKSLLAVGEAGLALGAGHLNEHSRAPCPLRPPSWMTSSVWR